MVSMKKNKMQLVEDGGCGHCAEGELGTVGADASGEPNTKGSNPDHAASKKRINRIRGQLDAVARMIDEREYCPDIIQQIRAANSAMRSLETEILRGHLRGCVREAFESKDGFEIHDKIDEILNLINR